MDESLFESKEGFLQQFLWEFLHGLLQDFSGKILKEFVKRFHKKILVVLSFFQWFHYKLMESLKKLMKESLNKLVEKSLEEVPEKSMKKISGRARAVNKPWWLSSNEWLVFFIFYVINMWYSKFERSDKVSSQQRCTIVFNHSENNPFVDTMQNHHRLYYSLHK